MSIRQVRTWEELDEKFAEANALASEKERFDFLCNHYFNIDNLQFPSDPFTTAYKGRALELWCRLSNRTAYLPDRHEPNGWGPEIDIASPSPFSIRSSRLIGDMLISWGFLMKVMDLAPGQSLLEYGPGSGQILINAARIGIRAAAVDISEAQIRLIDEQARRLGNLDVRARCGHFGDSVAPGEQYDAVLFFESFHHAFDHQTLVERLHDVVVDDGILVMAGEPIVECASPYRLVVPFPWGPRLDLLSLRAMRTHGWMELGFQEEYFVKLMHKAGWVLKKHLCPLTAMATTFVATKQRGRVAVGELYLPEDEALTWHEPEGACRWTRGRGVITLDARPRWRQVTVAITSHNPRHLAVAMTFGKEGLTVQIPPRETVLVTLQLPAGNRRLEIASATFRPRQLGINDDDRELGVSVGEIVYG